MSARLFALVTSIRTDRHAIVSRVLANFHEKKREKRCFCRRDRIIAERRKLILEKQWQKIVEIGAPDRPRVVTFGQEPLMLDAVCFERVNQRLIAIEQKVILTTRNPN